MQIDLVDVFGNGTLSGNPLAVVRGGEALSDEQMLALTRWLGFSETTFLLEPENAAADYRVRIFYPAGELPFAGHPTLGSARAWLTAGGRPLTAGEIVQECGIGLVTVRSDEDRLAFAAPPLIRKGDLTQEQRDRAVSLTGAAAGAVEAAVHIANGPDWQLLRLRSADNVLAAEPAAKASPGTDVGLAGPGGPGGADWEVRTFFADASGRLVEDPVTGSFNAGLAVHLFESGLEERSFTAAQGRKTGADGLVHCHRDADGTIWVGGTATMIAQGGALLPL